MKADAEAPTSSMDAVKWVVACALLILAIVANTVYDDISVVLRATGAVVLIGFAGVIAAMTAKGKEAINFARESRMEVRKVVWPTRQETLQTTFIVLAVTVVAALILWGIDGIMVRLVRLFAGV